MHFSFPYKTKVEKFELSAGLAVQFESIEDLNDTIDAFFDEYEKSQRTELFEDLCPYFGQLWPAGQALAEFVSSRAKGWAGKRVLEIGCGLALPSLVLAKMGCPVTAMDLHPDVPAFLGRNIDRNRIEGLRYRQEDWRKSLSEETWDIIIGSDILYDKEQPEELLNFLERRAAPGAEIIITDPGRVYYNRFLQSAQRAGWKREEEIVASGEAFISRLYR